MDREATKKQRKSELQASFKQHREALYEELNVSSTRVVDFGKNMAIIGSVLYVGYTVLDRYLEAKLNSESKKQEDGKYATLHKIILPLLAMALQQGSTLLLKRAKNMLIDYLEEKNKKDV
jgi:hypothetical protein